MTDIGGDAPGVRFEGRRLWIVLGLLTVLAALPRFAELGHLSFYGDEETTALPAMALAEGKGAEMPTGMEYRRGLTVTWLSAASSRLLGPDNDLSYRLPAAILGTLTVPLLFLFGRRYLGTGIALVAATALALSEWHLVFSRMARMYAPLVFFFLATGYAVWKWADTGKLRDLLLAAGLFVVAVATHALAVFVVIFAVLPIAFREDRETSPAALAAFAAVGVVGARLYSQMFVGVPFRTWGSGPPPEGEAAAATLPWQVEALAGPVGPWWLLAGVGGALGVWAGVRILGSGGRPELSLRALGMAAVAGVAGALLAAGQLWGGAAFGLAFLVVHTGSRMEALRRAAGPLVLILALGAWCLFADVASLGVAGGLKEAVVFPFPYLLYLFREFPGIVALFGAACLWSALAPARDGEFGLRATLLVALFLLLAVGSFRGWSHLRFLLPALPFLLLVAAAALVRGTEWAVGRIGSPRLPSWTGVAVSIGIVLSGLLGAHGVAAAYGTATLDHGQTVDADLHQQPFRPDHESAGEFIRSSRREGDLVVAEDPLQQRWYAGPVDYWFRRLGDARPFLFEAEDGSYRDMYVGSELISEPAVLDSVARTAGGSVWFVTSGETAHNRDWYLSSEQRRWLDSLERARRPAFVARDSVTSVYCLNCEEEGPRRGK